MQVISTDRNTETATIRLSLEEIEAYELFDLAKRVRSHDSHIVCTCDHQRYHHYDRGYGYRKVYEKCYSLDKDWEECPCKKFVETEETRYED